MGKVEIIFNGGKPLPGCPESHEQANDWAYFANTGKDLDYEPIWSFSCGYKLDFDGPLIRLISRFYPPAEYYGDKWTGSCTMFLFGKAIHKKHFECDTLEDLKENVEAFLENIQKDLAIHNWGALSSARKGDK